MIDFTKMRKGSRAPDGRRIEVCPKCGRKGTVSRYRDGSQLVVHTGENIGIGLSVREKCFVAAPKADTAKA